MNAKRCDRCKKFYIPPSTHSMRKYVVEQNSGGVLNRLDICDECYSHLNLWMCEKPSEVDHDKSIPEDYNPFADENASKNITVY